MQRFAFLSKKISVAIFSGQSLLLFTIYIYIYIYINLNFILFTLDSMNATIIVSSYFGKYVDISHKIPIVFLYFNHRIHA